MMSPKQQSMARKLLKQKRRFAQANQGGVSAPRTSNIYAYGKPAELAPRPVPVAAPKPVWSAERARSFASLLFGRPF